MTERRIIEIRTYRLRPGSKQAFHALVRDVSIPMVRRWGGDVVCFGPCLHEDTSYVLVRAYESVAALQSDQDAFYASDEWRNGPRGAILSHIDQMVSVVLRVDAETINAMRTLQAIENTGIRSS